MTNDATRRSPTQTLPATALFATISGWPDAREALRHIVPQVVAVGGEAVIADGSGRPAPDAEELRALGADESTVRWLSRPGESVFQLRRAGYAAARGEVVAITEDHVHVADGWLAAHLRAHAEHPQAGAVGGGVLNGTDQKLVDWAAFFLTQGPFMPPLANGISERISGAANVSYKRRVLERLTSGGGEDVGLIDWLEFPRALEGEALVADDRALVRHHQSQGLLRTSLAEFDNGRTIAGYRRRRMERGDWLRLLGAPLLPIYRSVRALRIVSGRDHPPGILRRAAPAHVWFQYCAMAGEVLGYLFGPGGSPRRLY